MFKVGDSVICVSIHTAPTNILCVGSIYKILRISSCREYVSVFARFDYPNFFATRFKKIDDSPINRLLYPEAFNEV